MRNPDFTGREELLQALHEQLSSSRADAALPHALHGLGGVGKTQVAVEYAYRYGDAYDLVWWISAEDPVQVQRSLAELNGALSVSTGHRGGCPHTLLIFDNAAEPSDLLPLISELTGHILVTSRHPAWGDVDEAIEVGALAAQQTSDRPPRQGRKADAVRSTELPLYGRICAVIAGDWARDHGIQPLAVEVTASQGSRSTGGPWTRPDIACVEVRTFDYIPGKHLALITFEVKTANAINVQAVYEALNHRAAASRSYVVLHVPPDRAARLKSAVANVVKAARSTGIGLLVVRDPGDYGSWEELVEAVRVDLNHERADEFIATQLSDGARKLIARALR